MIEEYRKISAEKLGYKWAIVEGISYAYNGPDDDSQLPWHPDKNANQREMIEDWLTAPEQKMGIQITYHHSLQQWAIQLWAVGVGRSGERPSGQNKSKPIAFMEAFIRYTEVQEWAAHIGAGQTFCKND